MRVISSSFFYIPYALEADQTGLHDLISFIHHKFSSVSLQLHLLIQSEL